MSHSHTHPYLVICCAPPECDRYASMATTSFSPYAAGRPPSASSLNRHLDLSRRICLPVHRPLASTAPLRAWGLAATPLRAAPARIAIRCGALAQIGQSEFATEVLGSELPVLVEFVADWCGPCRLISSVIEWASQVSASFNYFSLFCVC